MFRRILIIGVLIIVGIFAFISYHREIPQSITPSPAHTTEVSILKAPISQASSRITKKPFGIYVNPQNSPVQPEKFTGYHTGVDFETTGSEQEKDVSVYAICAGRLLQARTATGYGGVAVQSCTIDGHSVTVIYGHVRLSSITVKIGTELKAGEQFAVLGTGFSAETDGERKHLHLGVHVGSTVNIKGYVQTKSELDQWLNVEDYI